MDREAISPGRRKVLQGAGGGAVLALMAAAGLFRPGSAWAEWNQQAFEVKNSLNDAVRALGGSSAPEQSPAITITSPDIAENGAVVPVTVTSKIPGTQNIALMVEKNPNILAANFQIPDGTDPWINTRIKMGQTSNVFAVVKAADGKFYYASKEVKVTLGGCGG
ncbi:MAG TPA: thiosulfate oxidation carrier protein SoxY [Usitatibacter sp.]|jgi:sulfur-oxidizing protein SoxY|nr:thiosulfate oxidation carrier protein SoxY [Usitatibacter sp.]